jgi:hypothetical protein
MNYPTIVTMFYDIRKIENDESNKNKYKYIELAQQFILTLPYPIIFFIDDEDIETYNIINNTRKNIELFKFTIIIKINIKNTYFYKDLSILQELQNTYVINNINLNKDTPLYIILNNNKFFFIEKTIELNPFNSSHFIWMDFGINHVAKNPELIHEWITKVPDKIKQLCINPYIENTEPKTYFANILHNCAGGIFSGSKENMIKYIQLFKEKNEQIYNENWYQLDEAVMTMVQRENHELFDFYYGDYEGIISNYLKPLHSWWLIKLILQKCHNLNNTAFLYKILLYLDSYFLLPENCNNNVFDNYIHFSIICDYYHNNKYFRPLFIQLMNNLIKNKNANLIQLLQNDKGNINCYLNKDMILPFL